MTGLARPRQWDATLAVELPELAGETLAELGFMAFEERVSSAGARTHRGGVRARLRPRSTGR